MTVRFLKHIIMKFLLELKLKNNENVKIESEFSRSQYHLKYPFRFSALKIPYIYISVETSCLKFLYSFLRATARITSTTNTTASFCRTTKVLISKMKIQEEDAEEIESLLRI